MKISFVHLSKTPLSIFVVSFYHKGTQSLKEHFNIMYRIDGHYEVRNLSKFK